VRPAHRALLLPSFSALLSQENKTRRALQARSGQRACRRPAGMMTSAQHLASCFRAAALTRYSAEARKLSDDDTGCLWAAERRGVALTHVAVTSMRDEVFHGRLFFSEPSSSDGGAPPSAEAALECESKASDALWLALTTGAPVLMHKAVWDACALPLQRVLTNTAAALVEEQAAELVVPRVTAAAAAAEERPRLQLTQAAATDAEVTGAEGGEASEPIELNANATEAASEQSEALYTVYDTVAMEDSLREIQVAAPHPTSPRQRGALKRRVTRTIAGFRNGRNDSLLAYPITPLQLLGLPHHPHSALSVAFSEGDSPPSFSPHADGDDCGVMSQTGDPEPIKRLKRELHVAVGEEDYAAAARLRDHPFMRLYAQLKSAEAGGHFAQGKALRHELLHLITSQQQLNAAHMSLTGALKAFRVEHSLEAQM
jgi:hypothetical protein